MDRASVRSEHEVVVLGGGPAGCAAATLLAKRGHNVALVRPLTTPAAALAESIPPSALKLLRELAFLEPLVDAGLHVNGGNTVWWADQAGRAESFAAGQQGFHVDRAGLERVLVDSARAVGVSVVDAAARTATQSRDGWDVHCVKGGTCVELRAPWVLDATGRHGLLARSEGRRTERCTSTLALVRRWRRSGGFAAPADHTLVESYQDGWAWSVPLHPDVRCFTAMVDPRNVDLVNRDLDAVFDAELAKTSHLGPLLAKAEPCQRAWACPASLYTARSFGRRGLLLVGDAGSFIDPLSSFGVKKALSSGWFAGVTVHTALVDSSMCEDAVAFFDAHEREVYSNYRGLSAAFFEECAHAYEHEYWIVRAAAARAATQDAPMAGSGDPDAELFDAPGVPPEEARAALDTIRGRERMAVVRGATVHIVERPTVRGHRIVRLECLASARVPNGLRYVRNVDLRRVVELVPLYDDVVAGWGAYNAGGSPVTLPDYLAALATAVAAGFLEHRGGDAESEEAASGTRR
jgi:flavin-dependent dehydrogenase